MSAIRRRTRAESPAHRNPEQADSSSSLKRRVARIITSDRAGRIIGGVTRNQVRHHGLQFDLTSMDFTPRVRAQMFWGIYESAETRMINWYLRGSPTVVELGASLGVTTAHVASVMLPEGHLICVEANPHLLSGLRQRASRYSYSVQIDVIHAAISDHCSQAHLNIAAETVGSRLSDNDLSTKTIQVPALTLREVLNRGVIEDYDLVSDIEGSEAAFLLGDPSVLDRCQRAIMELHDTTVRGRQVSISDLLDAARDTGFRLIARHGPVVALSRS